DPHQMAGEIAAQREGALAAGMLDRVRDLMRRDRDGRDGAPVVMRRQKPHRLRVGIVVVAVIGGLDFDGLQAGLVQQMARELAAGAGKVRPLSAMPAQHVMDPELRAEHDREQDHYREAGDDRHGWLSWVPFWRASCDPRGHRTTGAATRSLYSTPRIRESS